ALHQWFVQARAEGVPISGTIVQAQAEKFDRQLNGEESTFKASTGWLDRFKKHHGISQVSVAGEVRSADTQAAKGYPDRLKEIISESGYSPEQIYNADGTGLCYKMLPDKTLASKTVAHKHEGYKKLKDRATILFCANKTGGHKIKPLCIGKSQNPRCFNHVNRTTLPLSYDFSNKAWMTSTIFEKWFHKEFVLAVRKHLRQQRLEPKALLLLDNCPAHPPASNLVSRDGKIRVSYLPKNTTSKIQLMDQGVISTFKTIYRRELVRKIVDDERPVQEFLKSVNIKEMIHLAGQSWNAVSAISIEKCWMKGLAPSFPTCLFI
ncbi:MAG: transposase, partial [Candidatus Thiodiazotropha sp.]